MKISHPHPTISSTSGQAECRKSLSPGGQKISSASYEALSPLAFTNLCAEIQDYLSEPEVEIVGRQVLDPAGLALPELGARGRYSPPFGSQEVASGRLFPSLHGPLPKRFGPVSRCPESAPHSTAV